MFFMNSPAKIQTAHAQAANLAGELSGIVELFFTGAVAITVTGRLGVTVAVRVGMAI
jgi:hypothetical protein